MTPAKERQSTPWCGDHPSVIAQEVIPKTEKSHPIIKVGVDRLVFEEIIDSAPSTASPSFPKSVTHKTEDAAVCAAVVHPRGRRSVPGGGTGKEAVVWRRHRRCCRERSRG